MSGTGTSFRKANDNTGLGGDEMFENMRSSLRQKSNLVEENFMNSEKTKKAFANLLGTLKKKAPKFDEDGNPM